MASGNSKPGPMPGPMPGDSDEGAILPWRIVAGAFLHFGVPAYLLSVPLACVLAGTRDATIGAALERALPFSGWFLALYALAAILATLAAATIDPLLRARRARRIARDPRAAALASDRRLSRAVTQGRRLLGDRAAVPLDRMSAARWDHADPRFQALSADLANVVGTAAQALTTAPPERHAPLLQVTTDALARLETALGTLLTERSRLDEGDALTMARYVESRYGSADFAGDGN
jgi:hypothetical protein